MAVRSPTRKPRAMARDCLDGGRTPRPRRQPRTSAKVHAHGEDADNAVVRKGTSPWGSRLRPKLSPLQPADDGVGPPAYSRARDSTLAAHRIALLDTRSPSKSGRHRFTMKVRAEARSARDPRTGPPERKSARGSTSCTSARNETSSMNCVAAASPRHENARYTPGDAELGESSSLLRTVRQPRWRRPREQKTREDADQVRTRGQPEILGGFTRRLTSWCPRCTPFEVADVRAA